MSKLARSVLVAGAGLLAVGVQCDSHPTDPPACAAIGEPMPRVKLARPLDLDPDVVWGVADLHAHPAIEQAFGGRLVWGTALDSVPIDSTRLPAIEPCPVETHDHDQSAPVDRSVGAQVFPKLASLGGFAHAPVGSAGYRTVSAWPNARDVIHQQMNVASIRRAYEGGLRLMFASTTDDQVISALLQGPNIHDGFVPDPSADYESAKRQLDQIRAMVAENAEWMQIARTPSEARDIIQHGKLAIVLSLEMNGLAAEQAQLLFTNYEVRHMIPIHLVDNDVGGTATNGGLFASSSAAASELYIGVAQQFMTLRSSAAYGRPTSWPSQVSTLSPAPLYLGLTSVPYSKYLGMCYENLDACAGVAPIETRFEELGQRNAIGLRDPARVYRLLHMGSGENRMMIDVSHMSYQSVADTLALDDEVPVMASHGDIAHLCEGLNDPACEAIDVQSGPVAERSLRATQARELVRRHGVLGFGTGVDSYDARSVFATRAGPLFTLTPTRPSGCVATDGGTCALVPPPLADAALAAPLRTLHVQVDGGPLYGGVDPNARPFVRVELRDGDDARPRAKRTYQRRVLVVPLACSSQACSADVPIAPPDQTMVEDPDGDQAGACFPYPGAPSSRKTDFTVDDLQSVTLEWLYLACDGQCQSNAGSGITVDQCQSTWDDDRAPSWPIHAATLTHDDSPTVLARAAPRDPTPIVMLDARKRGQYTLFDRDDRPSAHADVLASGHLLRVVMHSAADSDLLGASPARAGANVCVALRSLQNGACASTAAPPPPGATECADGWTPLNQRGEWGSDVDLYTFVRWPGSDGALCGLDVSVLDWDQASAPFSIDEVRVEAIEDPVGRWVRRYAQIAKYVAGGQMGVVALGTDFNGLNGMLDISENPVPPDAVNPSACPTNGTEADALPPSPVAPFRILNADGTVGTTIRIDERGLATYGLITDFLSIVRDYPVCGDDVYRSLMLSAEGTLRMWEALVDPAALAKRKPLPVAAFACDGRIREGAP